MESGEHSYSTSFTDRTNVATYYFKHESAESDEDNKHKVDKHNSIDSDHGLSNLSLRYSKEEISDLASHAELMVLRKTGFERKGVKTMGYNESCQANKDTDDSDYGSRLEYDSFISSDPNIALRNISPTRKLFNSKQKDWRHSLPTSLEFFSPDLGIETDTKNTNLGDISKESNITFDEFTDRENYKMITPDKLKSLEENLDMHPYDSWDEESLFSESILSSDSDSPEENKSNINKIQLRDEQRVCNGLSSTDDDVGNSKQENKRERKKSKINQTQQSHTKLGTRHQDAIFTESRNALYSKNEYIKNLGIGFLKAEEEDSGKKECQENIRKLVNSLTGTNLRSIESLCWQWERWSEQWTELSDQSAAYHALNQAITNMKQELLVLSSTQSQQEPTNYQKQVDIWQNVESTLQKLKQRLFPLNLSVHELQVSVSSSKIKNSTRVSLVSQCKQEVTQLYKIWEEKNNFVATKVQHSRKLLRQQGLRKKKSVIGKKKGKSSRGKLNSNYCECICQSSSFQETVNGQNISQIDEIARLKVTMNGLRNKCLINERSYKQMMKTINDLEKSKTKTLPVKWTLSWKSITKTYFSSTFLLLTLMFMMYYFCVPKCCDFKYRKLADIFMQN